MANDSKAPTVKLAGDVIQIEFVIDDLVKKLIDDGLGAALEPLSCKGCSHCAAVAEPVDAEPVDATPAKVKK